LGRARLQRLRKNSRMRAAPWKSGASARRKAPQIRAGFSPRGCILCLGRVFPHPLQPLRFRSWPPAEDLWMPQVARANLFSADHIRLSIPVLNLLDVEFLLPAGPRSTHSSCEQPSYRGLSPWPRRARCETRPCPWDWSACSRWCTGCGYRAPRCC
jgi:hypothetical protein